MTLQAFIEKYNGAGNVGNTPENKGECVGVVMVWLKDQGLPHIWGHAFSLLVNADPKAYEVIKNTPDGVPQPGDVIVWTKGFNGTYGHTAIVVKATVNTFEVFEQNVPLGSPCRLHTYKNYAYVDGWLKPKVQPRDPDPSIEDLMRAAAVVKTWKDKLKVSGNYEGWANALTQDAWPFWIEYKDYDFSLQIPPVTVPDAPKTPDSFTFEGLVKYFLSYVRTFSG